MKCSAFLLAVVLLSAPATAQFLRGSIYVADFQNNKVYEVDPDTFAVSVFADAGDGLLRPSALGFTRNAELLISSFGNLQVFQFDADGSGAPVLNWNDGLRGPLGENGIAVNGLGQVFISDYNAGCIFRFEGDYTGGTIFADRSDGILFPDGLALLPLGDLLVANRGSGGELLRFDPDGEVELFDQINGQDCYSVVLRNNGDLYVGCSSGTVFRYPEGDITRRHRLGIYGSGNLSLQFSPEFDLLYSVSSGDGKLRTIDPVTGDDTVVVDEGWKAVALTVFAGRNPPGSLTDFGIGLPGSENFLPTLHGTGDPFLGGTVTMEARDFLGGTSSFQLIGTDAANSPFLGGNLYINLGAPFLLRFVFLPGTQAGEGDIDLSYTLTYNPALIGLRIYFQQFAFDAEAAQGISMTNGVEMFIGEEEEEEE